MAFHIRNAQTDKLARQLAQAKRTGITEAVHEALANELARVKSQPSLVELGLAFSRELRAKGDQKLARPVDRDFIDSLYGES